MSLLRARESIQCQLYQSGRPGTECSAAVGLDANALQPPVFIRLIAERRYIHQEKRICVPARPDSVPGQFSCILRAELGCAAVKVGCELFDGDLAAIARADGREGAADARGKHDRRRQDRGKPALPAKRLCRLLRLPFPVKRFFLLFRAAALIQAHPAVNGDPRAKAAPDEPRRPVQPLGVAQLRAAEVPD